MREVRTIDRVRFVGKWVEFWFIEGPLPSHDGMSFHACAKGGYLMEAIERAGIYDEVMSRGLHGRKLAWVQVTYNWEIGDFVLPKEEEHVRA